MNHKLTVFEDSYDAFIKLQKGKAAIGKPTELKDVVELIKMMQSFKMDDHCGITGQNGVGKSYGLMMLMKEYYGNAPWMPNMLMADKTTNDVIDFALNNSQTLCGIDELNLYFNYKKHADAEQVHLINMLELARENSIGFVGNIRDPRKLTLNYRQGKLSIVIWTIDRYVEGGAYAALFVANPSVESKDKFGFSWLNSDIQSFAELREIFENRIPSFVNYVRFPNVKDVLTQKEIDEYSIMKQSAMAHAHLNHLSKQLKKKKLDMEDFTNEVEKLRKKLGDALIDQVLVAAQSKQQSKKQRFIEEYMGDD